jgi:TldD protein
MLECKAQLFFQKATMSQSLSLATQQLLTPSDLLISDLENVFNHLASSQIDYADIYLQHSQSESWVLEDHIIKNGSFSLARGVGIRAISGEKTGFAYADDINLVQLRKAADAARSIALHGGARFKLPRLQQSTSPIKLLYDQSNPLTAQDSVTKTAFLQNIDQYASALDSRIKQVIASLSAEYEVIMVAATDGTLAADIRPLVRFNISIIAEENGRRESATTGGGGRYNYDKFFANDAEVAKYFARDAVRQALVLLEAQPAPSGMMPVVLGPGWPGVLLHEAVGHGLEGDANRRGVSAFSGRLGELVASPLCTVVDDGTLNNRRGSLNIDDEGTPTQCTTLIENGRLVNYMQDKLNARLMGMKSTGNGRRESFASITIPRMTNTYMLPGKDDPNDIIASMDRGLYAVNFSGGQVDITSGQFVFSTSEAYWVENGKIAYPVKGAMLVGNGPDVMNKITMVGNDLALDQGVGVCGKDGQSVPVGVGQPTLKISSLTVGGTGGIEEQSEELI